MVDINRILLDDVQEVSIGDAHEDLLDLFLGVEPSQTIGPVFLGFLISEAQLVDVMGHIQHPVALIDQLMDDRPIPMTREVKIPRHSIDLKKSSHPASSFGIDILNNLSQFLLIRHPIILILLPFRKRDLLKIILHVHQMHLQDVLDIQRQETARIPRELDIYVHL